jgi:hypothetical protein
VTEGREGGSEVRGVVAGEGDVEGEVHAEDGVGVGKPPGQHVDVGPVTKVEDEGGSGDELGEERGGPGDEGGGAWVEGGKGDRCAEDEVGGTDAVDEDAAAGGEAGLGGKPGEFAEGLNVVGENCGVGGGQHEPLPLGYEGKPSEGPRTRAPVTSK